MSIFTSNNSFAVPSVSNLTLIRLCGEIAALTKLSKKFKTTSFHLSLKWNAEEESQGVNGNVDGGVDMLGSYWDEEEGEELEYMIAPMFRSQMLNAIEESQTTLYGAVWEYAYLCELNGTAFSAEEFKSWFDQYRTFALVYCEYEEGEKGGDYLAKLPAGEWWNCSKTAVSAYQSYKKDSRKISELATAQLARVDYEDPHCIDVLWTGRIFLQDLVG